MYQVLGTAHEAPRAVDPGVRVGIGDGLHDPPIRDLVLRLAVDDAVGMVGVVDVDRLTADHVDAAIEAAEDRAVEAAHPVTTEPVGSAHPCVRRPQGGERAEVAASTATATA